MFTILLEKLLGVMSAAILFHQYFNMIQKGQAAGYVPAQLTSGVRRNIYTNQDQKPTKGFSLKVERLIVKATGMHVSFIFTKSEFKSRRDT